MRRPNFGQHGVRFARQTACDCCASLIKLLAPLTELIRQEVLASRVLHSDNAPVNLRDVRADVPRRLTTTEPANLANLFPKRWRPE